MTNSVRCNLAAICILLCLPSYAEGQPANEDILGQLAARCIFDNLPEADSITMLPDPAYPFVRSAVVQVLHDRSATVFLVAAGADSSAAVGTRQTLRYVVESGGVTYGKVDRKRVSRQVRLRLRYILSDRRSGVLADSACTDTFEDQIPLSALDDVENPSYGMTVGNRPRKGWVRRIAEPAVVAAASVVAVYLFFNVRSDASNTQ